MQTHAPSHADHTKQAPSQTIQPTQSVAEAQGEFMDTRPGMAESRQLRQLMDNSQQVAGARALQAMMNNSAQAGKARALQALMNRSPQLHRAQMGPLQMRADGHAAPREPAPFAPSDATTGISKQTGTPRVTGHTPIQRKIRIGASYDFIGREQALPDELVAGEAATEVVNALKAMAIVYSFEDLAELQELATAIDTVAGSAALILRALHDPLFNDRFAQARTWLHIKLGDWMMGQMQALQQTVRDQQRDQLFARARLQITECISPEASLRVLVAAQAMVVNYQIRPFILNNDRQFNEDSGPGDIEDQTYGYHLTKIHNLKGIMARGLQPAEGAGKGGSLAMSTVAQQKGSQKTSEGMIAYGLHPETFRPYINQFEDRRQLIMGQPAALKPVLLRFLITPAVRQRSIQLPIDGVFDFMDRTAINSDIPVAPDLIEVLTPRGFIPLAFFDYTDTEQILGLREEDDDARMEDEWAGHLAIFDWEQLSAQAPLVQLLGFNQQRQQQSYSAEVTRLNRLRDTGKAAIGKLTYTYRGATYQTSGNPQNWQYAFSIEGKKDDIPKPVWDRINDYQEHFHDLAASLIGRLDQKYTPVGPQALGRDQLAELFRLGNSPGTNLNCLLYTIDQLRHNTEQYSENRVATMREVLTAAGIADGNGEIDIYGGAGMQIANDLGVRLQVFERIGHNQFIEHPILGAAGPVLPIRHSNNHFAPLWPL